MLANRTSGVPPVRAILAPTTFARPTNDCRLTFVPALPLVPVIDLVAEAFRLVDPELVAWAELGPDDSDLWAPLALALGDQVAPTAEAVLEYLATRDRPLQLVVVIPASASSAADSALLGLLDAAPNLTLIVIAAGRRPIETASFMRPDAVVVPSAALVLDAPGILSYATSRGFELSAEEAATLARTAATLPDVLPAVVSAAISGGADQPGPRKVWLEAEASLALRNLVAAADDDYLRGLLPFAVPYLLTPSALAAADPHGGAPNLPAIASIGLIDHDAPAGGYRVRFALRQAVLPELERRFPDEVRRIDQLLGEQYRADGHGIASAVHFANAEEWEAAVDVIDRWLLPLVAHDRQGLRSLLQSLPRSVRDKNPRLMLMAELGLRNSSDPDRATLSVDRRTAGLFSLLPSHLEPMDDLISQLVRTMVARTKGDYSVALVAATELDRLLGCDELASAPLATIAEAHYQAGLSRLLALDLVQARESFSRAWKCAESLTEPGLSTAQRAAGGAALVRALEGEAVEAAAWLDRVDGDILDTAGTVARALIAIGRLGRPQATHWLARLGDVAVDDELWCFAVHASNRYGLYWGDLVETEAELDRRWADHSLHLGAESTAHVLLTADAADLALMLGHVSRAETILKAYPERNSWIAASRARLELVRDNPQHALIAILEGQGRARFERYAQLDLAVLRAAAELDLGRTEDAAASTARAINLAEKSGVVVPFQLLPAGTLARLVALGADASDFVARHELTGTSYVTPGVQRASALSERELVVLRALDPTITVEQIAKRLFVAGNTVKAQLRSIYRKLGVSSRTEALLVAAEFGLLEDRSA